MVAEIGRQAWRALGGEPRLLDLVEPPEPPVVLGGRLDTAALLGDSVALATLALHRVLVERGMRPEVGPVRVAGDRVVTSAQSDRHLTLDGERPEVWSSLSGFWQTADGWVRTHGNYPHHAARLAALLGLPVDAARDVVARAISRRGRFELEDAAAAAGAVVGAVRTSDEWDRLPQADVVRRAPAVRLERIGDAAPRTWAPDPTAPLSGVRVLDLTRVIAGPVATRDLAFAGATVLRLDPPSMPEIGWQHLDTGQGKHSAILDLGPGGTTLHELLAQADVVVTGYRPHALDRFDLSAAALAERHPGLVVASVSAWGAEGPWADRRGFDSIVQAVTGIAVRESKDGSTPGALPAQALDHSAGHLLAAAVVEALLRQRREGGTWQVGVTLATMSELLRGSPPLPAAAPAAVPPPRPTLQQMDTEAGLVVCARPPLVHDGAPDVFPDPSRPWGRDEPTW